MHRRASAPFRNVWFWPAWVAWIGPPQHRLRFASPSVQWNSSLHFRICLVFFWGDTGRNVPSTIGVIGFPFCISFCRGLELTWMILGVFVSWGMLGRVVRYYNIPLCSYFTLRIVYQSSDLVGFLSELISFELRQCEGEDVFGVYAVSDVHTDKRFRWFSDPPKKKPMEPALNLSSWVHLRWFYREGIVQIICFQYVPCTVHPIKFLLR
jgi:hypothetical protein